MSFNNKIMLLVLAALLVGAPNTAAADSTVVAQTELKWKDMGNGITAAPVSGDMEKGASRFFLKYPVGLVTPQHHHDPDHFVTLVSGTITLSTAGKEFLLGPGSYFSLTDKAAHAVKVEGDKEAVFFIQANGPWNVVMEK